MNNTTTVGPQATKDTLIYTEAFVEFYIQSLLCLTGFLLNLVCAYIFAHLRSITPSYVVLMTLSLADAITLACRIPVGTLYIYFEHPVTNMTESISAWLTVLLAVERYALMRHWTFARRYLTPLTLRRIILAIVLTAIILNSPFFAVRLVWFSRSVDKRLELKSEWTDFYMSTYYTVFSWLRFVLVQLIPLWLLCYFNCLLFSTVYRHNNRFSHKLSWFNRMRRVGRREHRAPTITFDDSCGNGVERASQSINGEFLSDNGPGQNPSDKLVTQTVGDSVGPVTTSHVARPSNLDQRRRGQQRKLTIVLIAVILLFCIAHIPQAFAYSKLFVMLVKSCSIVKITECDSHRIYRTVTSLLTHLAFTCNFFLYAFLNRDFKQRLIGMFKLYCCRRCQKQRRRINDDVTNINKPESTYPVDNGGLSSRVCVEQGKGYKAIK